MSESKRRPKLGSVYCVHDDWHFLEHSIRSFLPAGPVHVLVSTEPWGGSAGHWQRSVCAAEKAGATVVTGEWPTESDHRKAALALAHKQRFTHVLTPDGDEIIEPRLLEYLVSIAQHDLADVVHVEWDTYWHSPHYVVRPREPFRPVMMVSMKAEHVHIRHYSGERVQLVGDGYGIVHHLSYCGPDERIKRKVTSWSHKDELVPGWWNEKWLKWKQDKTLRNLHPTHPENYAFVERIPVPAILEGIVECACDRSSASKLPRKKWPTVSVVVPLHGGADDIERCLQSLEECKDLLQEVIVVDNASPDDAPMVAETHKWVKLLKNDTNLGFATASNQGYEESTGSVVLFLNSDTVVPRGGLTALVEDLTSSGTIAAAGPVSNAVGHFQRIAPTYTSLGTMPLFAEDLAGSSTAPEDTDMLVGFCLAVKRDVLDEVGAFDESFGLGLFEDNDLCHRMRREGYRLVISRRAFVHHKGSATMQRSGLDFETMLRENEARYRKKWQSDLDMGFVDHLPGTWGGRCNYNVDRKPERLLESLRPQVDLADISLCMIVKNEERVLGDCLKSAVPYFKEVIVVDTGSTDATVEIARTYGAKVHIHPWEDSFSVARNHSLSYARGRWVFWMDADDTLPFETGVSLLNAAIGAPDNVVGFVVPVQFVDEGAGAGTRVDHVKLFRNLPGARFEGRIHEQILGSLRGHFGDIARLDTVVLHSGYDTSDEGQARKRDRDNRLLALDLAERPNHPFVHFNLGMTAHYTGGHHEAVDWLRKSIQLASPGESHTRKAYALMAASYRSLGDDRKALETLQEGLDSVGNDPELHFAFGQVFTSLERLELALDHYDRVLACDVSGHFSSVDIGILGFKTLHNSAGVLADLGRYTEAKGRYLDALGQAPRFVQSALALFELAMRNGDTKTAGFCVDHVLAQEGASATWCDMVRERAQALGGLPFCTAVFESQLRHEPASIPVRIALSKAYFDGNRFDLALNALSPLVEARNAEAAFLSGVCHLRWGNPAAARKMVKLAMELNPSHQQTQDLLRSLNRTLGFAEEEDVL